VPELRKERGGDGLDPFWSSPYRRKISIEKRKTSESPEEERGGGGRRGGSALPSRTERNNIARYVLGDTLDKGEKTIFGGGRQASRSAYWGKGDAPGDFHSEGKPPWTGSRPEKRKGVGGPRT